MKPASLSGSILVPKGTAAPTNSPGAPASQAVRVAMASKLSGVGAGPSGLTPPPDSGRLAPAPSPVAPPAAQALQPRPAPPRAPLPEGVVGERVNLSFRLDPDRHLRLKLAAAHLRKSSQRILELALDSYLERMVPHCAKGQCACLGDEADDEPDGDNAEDGDGD